MFTELIELGPATVFNFPGFADLTLLETATLILVLVMPKSPELCAALLAGSSVGSPRDCPLSERYIYDLFTFYDLN